VLSIDEEVPTTLVDIRPLANWIVATPDVY
jgi:hypothetical protein